MRFNPLHNLMLKLSAVALALLLWVHVATNKTYEYQVELPLRLINVPRGLVMISDLPNSVSIKIKATGKQLLALTTREPLLTISAADYKVGTFEFVISNPKVISALDRVYEDVEVLYPKDVILRFEQEAERKLPVISVVRAEAAPGFAVTSAPKITPDSVEVVGPQPSISKLKRIETTETQFVNLTAPVHQKISLALPESLKLHVKDSTVFINIAVERRIQRTISDLDITLPNNFNANRYDIMPSRLTLTVGIPESRAAKFSESDVEVSFKRPPVLGDTVKAALIYKLPDSVELVGNAPDSVMIVRKP